MALDLKSFAIGKANGSGGGDVEVKPLTVTANGIYSDLGNVAYKPVRVQVPTPTLEDVTITQNGITEAIEGKAFKKVTVEVPTYPEPTGSINITENGTYDIKDKAVAEVNVQGGGISGEYSVENHRKWLELNGYTTVEFTLTSIATTNFEIAHPLGRVPTSIIAIRKDVENISDVEEIVSAHSLDGDTADSDKNRIHNSRILPYLAVTLGAGPKTNDYSAVTVAPTSSVVTLRANGLPDFLKWAVGNYYLFIK